MKKHASGFQRVLSLAMALIMVLSLAPFGTLKAKAATEVSVGDTVKLSVGDASYDMLVYAGGVWEAALTGVTGTAELVVNGTKTGETIELSGDTVVRLKNGALSTVNVEPAAIVGSLSGINSAISDWSPDDPDAELTYVGNGWYSGTFAVSAAAETTIQYKIAFNDGWADCIGSNGWEGGDTNISLTIPAGTTELKLMVDSGSAVVYDSITNSNVGKSVALAGTMNGWDTTATKLTQVSEKLYVCQLDLEANSYEYKFVVDGSSWIPNDNQKITVDNAGTVVFLYNAADGSVIDSVTNAASAESLLSGGAAIMAR